MFSHPIGPFTLLDLVEKIPRGPNFKQPTPRDNTPRELKHCELAKVLVDGEWVKFADVEDSDNNADFQHSLDNLFQLMEDVEEYEAKYGPVLGISRKRKLRHIMDWQRTQYATEHANDEDPVEAEIEL